MSSTRGKRRGWPIISVAGALAAVLVPWGWTVVQRSHGTSPGFDVAAASRALSDATVTPSATAPAPSASIPTSRTSTTTAAPSAPHSAPPATLQIASIAVHAAVQAVGVDAAGAMAIPERVDVVGWYRWSPLPGSVAGSVVLAGHVDSATQGLGALYRLRDVQAQAEILITGSDGRKWHYRVVSRHEYPKTSVPLAGLFTLTGPPRLVVITCGGRFDAAARSYEDNIVVTAEPL